MVKIMTSMIPSHRPSTALYLETCVHPNMENAAASAFTIPYLFGYKIGFSISRKGYKIGFSISRSGYKKGFSTCKRSPNI